MYLTCLACAGVSWSSAERALDHLRNSVPDRAVYVLRCTERLPANCCQVCCCIWYVARPHSTMLEQQQGSSMHWVVKATNNAYS